MNVLVACMHIWGTNLDFPGEAHVLKHDSLLHLHCFLLPGNRPDTCRAFWVSRVAPITKLCLEKSLKAEVVK